MPNGVAYSIYKWLHKRKTGGGASLTPYAFKRVGAIAAFNTVMKPGSINIAFQKKGEALRQAGRILNTKVK